jgi:Lar family restriction alleviation protein
MRVYNAQYAKEMSNPEKLKPCPFCGSKPNYSASCYDKYKGYCSIYCPTCGAGMSGYESKNEVLIAWNRRASDDRKT